MNPTEWFLDADGRIRDELYSGDYIHLTEEGYKLMADKIMKALLEQVDYFFAKFSFTLTKKYSIIFRY